MTEVSRDSFTDNFCEVCQVFEISPSKFVSGPFKGARVQQLGTYGDVQRRTSCPLCRLLTRAVLDAPIPHSARRSGSQNLDELRMQGCWTAISEGSDSACLVFHILHFEGGGTSLQVRPLFMNEKVSRHHHEARIIKNPRIEIAMVKNWLSDCEGSSDCPSRLNSKWTRRPAAFKVIDVVELKIIDQESPCRYLTLSYVWGAGPKFCLTKETLMGLSQGNGLNAHWDQLHPTIQDAIMFTKELGERYLWVDSLCIVQDDNLTKPRILEDMYLVYKQALVMLCAADDACVRVGIAGVNQKPRVVKQYTTTLGSEFALVASFDFKAYMETSLYHTRGWTYQEQQVAERTLVFINNQIYFYCSASVRTEDICSRSHQDLDDVSFFPRRSRVLAKEHSFAPILYFSSVEAFTARNLTFPSDILNAFIGTLSEQCISLFAQPHFGLPTSIFDLALLWQPTSQTSRRRGFPSWSWAGWYGSVKWYGDTFELASYGAEPPAKLREKKVAEWLKKHTWVDWHVQDSAGSMISLWQPELITRNNENVEQIGVTGEHMGYGTPLPGNLYGRQYDTDHHNMIEAIKTQSSSRFTTRQPSNPQHLHFFTVSTHYRITLSSAYSYLRYASIDPVWVPRGRVIFHILNRHLQICGYVLLDEPWRDKHMAAPDHLHEFILLSDANYHCEWRRPHEEHPYKKFWGGRDDDEYREFHAMMIEWQDTSDLGGKGGRICERVGLARLHEEAIQDAWEAGPIWKEITLG